jgi:exosome complex RNA-binding protein Rrp4
VAFLTDESAQGRRLNTDRDRFDDVLQVFNAVTGEVFNSFQQAIADSVCDLGGGRVAFLTQEAAQSRSLNGDRDKLDNVLQAFDAVANEVRNSFQQVVDGSLLDLGGGLVAFLTDESAQGRDLNADGDKQDEILQAFDSVLGLVRNSGSQAVAGSQQDIEGGFVAFVTSETEQDRRLNADGDKQDSVLQIFDAVSGIVQNTGQAVG